MRLCKGQSFGANRETELILVPERRRISIIDFVFSPPTLVHIEHSKTFKNTEMTLLLPHCCIAIVYPNRSKIISIQGVSEVNNDTSSCVLNGIVQ